MRYYWYVWRAVQKNSIWMHPPRNCCAFAKQTLPSKDYLGIECVLAGCEWRQQNGMRSAQYSFILLSVCDVEMAALSTSQLQHFAVDNAVVCGKSPSQSGDAMLRLVSWHCLHMPSPSSGRLCMSLLRDSAGKFLCFLVSVVPSTTCISMRSDTVN